MSDDVMLKHCPWCADLTIVNCKNCKKMVIAENSISAWNAFQREPTWIEYDGNPQTLPQEGKTVLVEISFQCHTKKVIFHTVACLNPKTLNGKVWWKIPMADPWDVNIGDRWMYWIESK